MGRCRLVVLDKTIEVACAPSSAFALLAEPARAPSWQPWTRRADAGQDPQRFAMVQEVCGLRLAWRGHADLDPVRSLTFEQDEGDFEEMEGTWNVEPTHEGGCRVRLRMRVALPFILPKLLTEGEIARCLSRSLDESLYNLKTLLETTHAPPFVRAGSGLPRADPATLPWGMARG